MNTTSHGTRVADIAEILAAGIGVNASVRKDLRTAALLHDVGKRYLPKAVIAKPGPLTERERRIIERHPELGARHVACLDGQLGAAKPLTLTVCLQHHERWDGGGYPCGLAGTAIHPGARIVALADVVEALGTDRCYRPAWGWESVRDFVIGQEARMFAPELIRTFLEREDEIRRVLTTVTLWTSGRRRA